MISMVEWNDTHCKILSNLYGTGYIELSKLYGTVISISVQPLWYRFAQLPEYTVQSIYICPTFMVQMF
jgi:hypothetical protein